MNTLLDPKRAAQRQAVIARSRELARRAERRQRALWQVRRTCQDEATRTPVNAA
jgi:hypothetical protein